MSYEKNVAVVLSLDLPGSSLVYGGGPRRKVLQQRYAGAIWQGWSMGAALPAIDGSADVLVFPSPEPRRHLRRRHAGSDGQPLFHPQGNL